MIKHSSKNSFTFTDMIMIRKFRFSTYEYIRRDSLLWCSAYFTEKNVSIVQINNQRI